jgi:hypothetical protein
MEEREKVLREYVGTLLIGMGFGVWATRLVSELVDSMRWWSFWNSVIGLLLLVIGAALLFWRHRPR